MKYQRMWMRILITRKNDECRVISLGIQIGYIRKHEEQCKKSLNKKQKKSKVTSVKWGWSELLPSPFFSSSPFASLTKTSDLRKAISYLQLPYHQRGDGGLLCYVMRRLVENQNYRKKSSGMIFLWRCLHNMNDHILVYFTMLFNVFVPRARYFDMLVFRGVVSTFAIFNKWTTLLLVGGMGSSCLIDTPT